VSQVVEPEVLEPGRFDRGFQWPQKASYDRVPNTSPSPPPRRARMASAGPVTTPLAALRLLHPNHPASPVYRGPRELKELSLAHAGIESHFGQIR
jgi:hypothetical protein